MGARPGRGRRAAGDPSPHPRGGRRSPDRSSRRSAASSTSRSRVHGESRASHSSRFLISFPIPAIARWSSSASAISRSSRDGSWSRRIASSTSTGSASRSGPSFESDGCSGLRPLLEQLDHRGVEAHGDRARHLDHERRPARGPAPGLARPVAVPRAAHPEVRPDLEPVVEPDQQVLAHRVDGRDRRSDEPLDLRSRRPRPCPGDLAADQVRTQSRGGAGERVALGHGLSAPAGRASPAAHTRGSRRRSRRRAARRGPATRRRARRRPWR